VPDDEGVLGQGILCGGLPDDGAVLDAPVTGVPVPAAQVAAVEEGLGTPHRLSPLLRGCGAAGTAGQEGKEEERASKLECDSMLQGVPLWLRASQSAHLFIYRRTFI